MRPIAPALAVVLMLVCMPMANADANPPIGDDGAPSLAHLEDAVTRAGMQRQGRRIDDAVAALEMLVKQQPDNARAKVVLARALLYQSPFVNRQRAGTLVDQALAADPAQVDAYAQRVHLAVDTGCMPCAADALSRARAVDAAAASVHGGEAYMLWGEIGRHMREPNMAGDVQAQVREKMTRLEQALRSAADAAPSPVQKAAYLQALADFLAFSGRQEAAFEALERATQLDPESWAPKLRYATAIAARKGRLMEAAELIESAGGPRDEETRDIVAAAAYAKWAKAWRDAPASAETRRLLAAAREEHPDVERVFQRVSSFEPTLDLAEAMLKARVYRVARAEYRDRDGDTALANLILNAGREMGEEARRLSPEALRVADALIAAGANPNAWASESREPLLAVAARMGDEALVAKLVKAGADVNAPGAAGATPIMAAAQSADHAAALAIARQLAARGARLAPVDDGGRDVLMAAASVGNDALARWLLERGADLQRTDRDGMNALDWAVDGGSEALVERLLKAGAQQTRVVGTCGVVSTEARARGNARIEALLRQYKRRDA